MSSKPLPLSFARCLIRLQDGEQLNPSEVKSKNLLKRFCEDGIIQKRALGNRRSGYVCPNAEVLQNYLRVQNGILSLENYIAEFENDASDGVSSLGASKSTKTFRGKSLQGFFIKAINSEMRISGKIVLPEPQGIELFVHQPEHLQISKTALVVGIENPECFLKFGKLAQLFPQQELVTVLRYMSNSPNRWLQTISNNYLHFGDFDPAGLNIYIHEYRRHLPTDRCDFFIPPNIEQLISRYGLSDLYDKQVHLLENIDRELYPEIEKLLVILDTQKKGLEQERLLVIM